MTPVLTDFQFVYAKEFATYLLSNKLQEASAENIRLTRNLNLPLLELFAHLPEDELLRMTQHSLQLFFEQMIAGTALDAALGEIDKWKADQVPGIPRQKVSVSDLVISYSIRRQLFLHFLPQYTSDPTQIVQVMQEIEMFYIQLERYAFQAFIDIQSEELHKKNEFLSSLINHSVDGIAAFDRTMRVMEWNPFLEKLNGIPKDQIIGKYIYELFPQYEQSAEAKATLQALDGKEVYLSDRPFITHKGWYDAHIVPFYGKDRQVAGALSIIRDITSRKEAEMQLKEYQEELLTANEELQEQKEELFSMNEELQENLAQMEEIQQVLSEKQERLLEAQAIAHLGNWEYSPALNTMYLSEEMKRIFGYEDTHMPFTFTSYLQSLHPQDQEAFESVITSALYSLQPFKFEHRIVLADGSMRWLFCQGKPLVHMGLVSKFTGTVLDITERKEAELKVYEDQHFIAKIADTSPDVITVYDLETQRNIYSSREIYEILGYTPAELEELKQKGVQGLIEVIHPDDLPMILTFLESYKTYTGNQAREMEYRIKDNKGRYRWILDKYNVFKKSQEQLPVQIIGIARDITPRRMAEEELKHLYYTLQETNEELVRSEEALKELNNELESRVERRTSELVQKNEQLSRINADLDNFIYTASHDLKSPIANIDGLLTALTRKVQDKLLPQDSVMLDMMRQSIERFNSTILDLTNIAKVQKNIEEEEIERVSFSELVTEVKSDIAPMIGEKQALLLDQLQVESISFAKKNLRSILYNLLTNAIKYSSPHRQPEIKIETSHASEYILLCVQDNGMGIPQGQQQKIFSLFKRVHTEVEGSGIGLYIVKRIIENNGGKIEVESAVDQGTTFRIYLKNIHTPKTEAEQSTHAADAKNIG
jgi:PAS domain S-box-containing protein